MTKSLVLQALYALEETQAQRGKLDEWFTPSDIRRSLLLSRVQLTEEELAVELRSLWTTRQVLQLCEPAVSGEQRQVVDYYGNEIQIEHNDMRSPSTLKRTVLVPGDGDLKSCRYRSRVAELRRLLSWNYQRYDMRPSTALVRSCSRRQLRACFDRAIEGFRDDLSAELRRGKIVVDGTSFSLDGRMNPDPLAESAELVLDAVADILQNSPELALFQTEAIRHTLAGLYSNKYRKRHDGHIITAGVGSGKTYAFQVGALIHAINQFRRGKRGICCLFLYPRVVLAQNQTLDLTRLLRAIRRRNPSLQSVPDPVLDAGGQLTKFGTGRGVLLSALRNSYQGDPSLVISNLETLANRLANPEAGPHLTQNLDLIVIDEAHLLSGVYGANARALINRIVVQRAVARAKAGASMDLPALRRVLARSVKRRPYFIGASATIAEPRLHLARLTSSDPTRIRWVFPNRPEVEERGYVHHLFLRQFPNMSSLSAATNAVSCLLHNRRDGLHTDYYRHAKGEPVTYNKIFFETVKSLPNSSKSASPDHRIKAVACIKNRTWT